MVNELKVFYSCDKGLMTFEDKKIIFQHKGEELQDDVGLGIIDKNSIFDKGTYSFAKFIHVDTVIPESYYDIKMFANRGVPTKIEKGVYGRNILLKEYYSNKVYIRAYKADGSIGLYEANKISNDKYKGENFYYNRLDSLIENWEDITKLVVGKVIQSIDNLTCSIPYEDEEIQTALKGLNQIYQLSSGVILADGKFETLVIWSENDEVKMTWLGRKLNVECKSENEENQSENG